MTKSNGYSDLKLIDIKRMKRDALLVHNYALEYAEKHAPDWNDLPPVAPELVRCIKTAIENSCINSTTEFATWLISCNLASKLTLCVGLGVTSMAQFYLAAELPMDGQLQHMRAFLTSLYADVALQKRAQELCATIVPFKAYFPSALQYVCTMVEELAPCMHRMDLGVVSKRGELRTERWKERHVVLFRGELVYASPGSASALGVVQLDRAFVRETAPSETDRPFSIDLFVVKPTPRVFLFALNSEVEVQKWMSLVNLQRRFCLFYPERAATGSARLALK